MNKVPSFLILFLFSLIFLWSSNAADNVPHTASACERALTVGDIYNYGRDHRQNVDVTNNDTKKVTFDTTGFSPEEVALVDSLSYLRPVFVSGILEEAIRVGILSTGTDSKKLSSTIEFIKVYAIPTSQVETIIENSVRFLKNENLPAVRAENMSRIDLIREKYNLSIGHYAALADLVNSESEDSQTKLRIGILSILVGCDPDFTNKIANPGFWKMRSSTKAAKQLFDRNLAKTKVNPSPFQEKILRIKEIHSWHWLSRDRSHAFTEALAQEVYRHAYNLSLNDLETLLDIIPFGIDWGIAQYNYKDGWLKKDHKGASYSDLQMIGVAIQNVTQRDREDLVPLQRRVMSSIERTYGWKRKEDNFRRDVYTLVQTEFDRIRALKFEGP